MLTTVYSMHWSRVVRKSNPSSARIVLLPSDAVYSRIEGCASFCGSTTLEGRTTQPDGQLLTRWVCWDLGLQYLSCSRNEECGEEEESELKWRSLIYYCRW